MNDIYEIKYPDTEKIPLVMDSPHSGRLYPDDFGYACAFEDLQRGEDNEVDILFANATDYGATFLKAHFPRTYIDVNRAIDDVEPDIMEAPHEKDFAPSPRAHAGIGLIRRIARPGVPVYDRKLRTEEIDSRIENYYIPYHEALQKLIDDTHYDYGQVWHVNCHSMPSYKSINSMAPQTVPMFSKQPDFVLGDRDGTSCTLDFTHSLRDYLRKRGFRVAINNPYRGVEIVYRHGQPSIGRHSIQIEINKALYWNESQQKRTADFRAFKQEIDDLQIYLASYVRSTLMTMAAD